MKILQGGVPKCGNFWLYQIIQEILKRAGRDASSFIEKQPIYQLAKDWDLNYPTQASIDVLDITDLQCSYRISSIYRMPIVSVENYVAETNHVWTHSPICKKSEEVLRHFDKKIYIIRDPRDRAVSASKYYTSEYMLKYYPQEETDPEKFLNKNFESLMKEWVWHVFDHLRMSQGNNIHILFYENLLADFQEELSRLLEYLELELSTSEMKAIEKEVSFDKLKQTNPKHLKTGKSGYWQEQLSEEQKQKAEAIAGPLMEDLGYINGGIPQFQKSYTEEDFEHLRQRIIGGRDQF